MISFNNTTGLVKQTRSNCCKDYDKYGNINYNIQVLRIFYENSRFMLGLWIVTGWIIDFKQKNDVFVYDIERHKNLIRNIVLVTSEFEMLIARIIGISRYW